MVLRGGCYLHASRMGCDVKGSLGSLTPLQICCDGYVATFTQWFSPLEQ